MSEFYFKICIKTLQPNKHRNGNKNWSEEILKQENLPKGCFPDDKD